MTTVAAASPARIMEVGMAFWPAKVLLSAIELGVFTELGRAAMTGPELREALQLHMRADPDFFDTLVALRFLERDGDGPGARYRNTPETGLFLDKNSPRYMGGFLEMANGPGLSATVRSVDGNGPIRLARVRPRHRNPDRMDRFCRATRAGR